MLLPMRDGSKEHVPIGTLPTLSAKAAMHSAASVSVQLIEKAGSL